MENTKHREGHRPPPFPRPLGLSPESPLPGSFLNRGISDPEMVTRNRDSQGQWDVCEVLSPPRQVFTTHNHTDAATAPFVFSKLSVPGTCCAGWGTCPSFQGPPKGQTPRST